MPQQTLTMGRDFGPAQSPAQLPKLGVYAPLDVQGAPAQAGLLAKSLGVAFENLRRPLMYVEEAEGAKSVKEGEAAAETGNIDPEMARKVDGYRLGAKRVTVEQQALQAINEATQKASTDWAGLPAYDSKNPDGSDKPGLMSNLDAYMKSKLGGLETDPEAATVLGPMLSHFYNEMAGKRVQQQVQNTVQTAVDNATALALHSFQMGDSSFSWKDQFQKLTQLGMDNHTASAQLVHAVGEAAVQAHDPALIDKYIPKTGEQGLPAGVSPGDQPENAAYLEQARTRAEALKAKDNVVAVNNSEVNVVTGILHGGDPRQALYAYAQMPGAKASFISSAWDWYRNLGKEEVNDQLNSGSAASVISDVLDQKITSASQLLDEVNARHITGKAMSQLLDKGLSTLRSVQQSVIDDPTVKANLTFLDQEYKPAVDILGNIRKPAEAVQHNGVRLDYLTETQKLISQGMSAEEASHKAMDDVRKKWGDPIERSNSLGNKNLPKTYEDQATLVLGATKDPQSLIHSGLGANEINSLVSDGFITLDQANAAAAAIIAHRYHK